MKLGRSKPWRNNSAIHSQSRVRFAAGHLLEVLCVNDERLHIVDALDQLVEWFLEHSGGLLRHMEAPRLKQPIDEREQTSVHLDLARPGGGYHGATTRTLP